MRRSVITAASVLVLAVGTSSARTWHITPGGTGDAPTIEAGIDSAAAGDTVKAACGTYYERDIVMKSGVHLEGEPDDPGCVVIDAEQQGRVFYCDGVDSTTEFEGITITNGLKDYGGGMACYYGASPRLTNVIFLRNHGSNGGGLICATGFSVVLRNVIFEENSSGSWGGGVTTDAEFGEGSIDLTNCRFVGNTAKGGAGMGCLCLTTARLHEVTFEDNVASGQTGTEYGGGGLYVEYESHARVTDCTFRRNWADRHGGGMWCYGPCETSIENCLFSENFAGWHGGGIYCMEDGPKIKYCTFDRNESGHFGGGISTYWEPCPAIDSCTFFMNEAPTASGIFCYEGSDPWIVRSIIAYGVGGEGVGVYPGSYAFIRCCNIYGNAGGDWVGAIAGQYGVNGNFSACPSFCYAPGDFHLCDESPCLPGNHPDGYACGRIGAWGEGCVCGPTRTEPSTWSSIKAMYR